MKRLSALILSLALFSGFTLHGFSHDGQAEHPCAVCKVGEAQHAAAAIVAVEAPGQTETTIALPATACGSTAPAAALTARAPPASA